VVHAAAGALALVGALALPACGDLQDFGGLAPPLVTFEITFSGDLAPLRPTGIASDRSLQVALVWGAQWLTEPFCVLPADTTVTQPPDPGFVEPAEVIKAGCRDPFGFVPASVAASVPLAPSGPTSLSVAQLPTADVLVGDVTARVAYGSFVVFDDRDGNGLQLAVPHRTPTGGRRGEDFNKEPTDSTDVVYGASFLTMTMPDRRASYHEGGPVGGAFYPRVGCPPLGPGFQVVGAGGFSAEAAVAATLMGQLPAETDPASCFASAPDATTIDIAAQAPADVQEVSCDERSLDSSIRYREPPAGAPDFSGRLLTCAHLPTFDTGSQPSSLIQLVVSGRDTDRCKGLTHYTLRGCRENVTCPVPDWDFTATPPSWWRCPQ
jgi:hypothetical protein